MLRIKSSPKHNKDIFIKPSFDVDPEWMLGRIDKDGNFIENEVECILDDRHCIIKLQNFQKKQFQFLPLLRMMLSGFGIEPEKEQQIMRLNHGNKIKPHTELYIIQYELIDFI